MREKCDGGVVMAHGLEGGVERERLRTMVAMASIFLDRDTKACQFRNGVRKGPLVCNSSQVVVLEWFTSDVSF